MYDKDYRYQILDDCMNGSKVEPGLVQRTHIVCNSLLVFLVEFYFESFPAYFETVHFLDSFLSCLRAIEAHKTDAFGFSILFSHDSGRVDVSELSEQLIEL